MDGLRLRCSPDAVRSGRSNVQPRVRPQMNILFDAQIFRHQRYGGISRYYCELAQRLNRRAGVRAMILALRHTNEYARLLQFPLVVGWHSGRTGAVNRAENFANRALAKASTRLFQADVVHETYFWGPVVRSARKARTITIYDMVHERYPGQFAPGDRTAALKREAARRADHVFCISESTRRDVVAMLDIEPSKLSVTPLSASLAPPDDGAPSPHDRPYLLYVGERGGYKNFVALVHALGGSKALAEFDLVCCGGGPIKRAEWTAIDAAGIERRRIVHRQGADDLLARLYAGAACFVYPSLYEGFGIPPLEAMRCGCPVACADTSSMPEVVGDAAECFDPTDVASIRAAIDSVVGSPARGAELRARGFLRASLFSWDRCADETLNVYRCLVGDGRG